jgi:hypothetical protein
MTTRLASILESGQKDPNRQAVNMANWLDGPAVYDRNRCNLAVLAVQENGEYP